MMTGVRLQTTAPGSAHADLGFWLQSQIIGQPMAMPEPHLVHLIEAITANRYSLPKERKTGARITDNGTAIVEIHGTLINRSPVMSSFWGLTSYEGLAEQFRRLETHAEVKRVVLDINSPGGMVMGIQAAAEAIERLAKKKPVHAIAHDMAASAGYWLAACAQSLSIMPDGEAGSIGVRSGHISYAEQFEREGIQVTMFSAGATKLDGSPYKLLTAGEAAEEQYAIERAYDRFVSHVAKARKMSEEAVRDTDARMYVGQAAVEAGLVDRVETLEDMIERLEGRKSETDRTKESAPARSTASREYLRRTSQAPVSGQHNGGTAKMSGTNGAAADHGGFDMESVVTHAVKAYASEEQRRQAVADNTVSKADAERMAEERAAAAVKADRERVAAILNHEEAKGREEMARKLAFDSTMAVDGVVDLLKAAPKSAATDAKPDGMGSALEKRMSKGGASASVRPDAVADHQRPSFASKIASRYGKGK